MNLIDVHILHLPNENQNWWKQCEQSLIGHPINIYNLEGIDGDVTTARKIGFLTGTAPYVSFVDPDDIVIPNSFNQCLIELKKNEDICGVYTKAKTIDEYGNEIYSHVTDWPFRKWSLTNMKKFPLEVHQLLVMKREDVEYYYEHYSTVPCSNSNQIMYAHLGARRPWKALNFIGYKWRNHVEGLHNKPHARSTEVYNYLQNILDEKETQHGI